MRTPLSVINHTVDGWRPSSSTSPSGSVTNISQSTDSASNATGGGEAANSAYPSLQQNSARPVSSHANGGEWTALPMKEYNRSLFQSLMSVVSRLFCNDEQIVVLDFLANEERSFTEKDLAEQLGWQEKRLREICASLEREKLVLKEPLSPFVTQQGASSTQSTHTKERGVLYKDLARTDKTLPAMGNAPFFYRINAHVIPVLQWRCRHIEEALENALQQGQMCDSFKCPSCGNAYDSLQAQCLELDTVDAHFLCKCGTRLEHKDEAEDLGRIMSLQKRFQEQVLVLRKHIERCWGMEVPTFAPFSKAASRYETAKSNEKKSLNAGLSVVDSGIGSVASSNPSDGDSRTYNGEMDGRRSDSNFKLKVTQTDPAAVQPKMTPIWLQKGRQQAEAESYLLQSTVQVSSHPMLPPTHHFAPSGAPMAPPVVHTGSTHRLAATVTSVPLTPHVEGSTGPMDAAASKTISNRSINKSESHPTASGGLTASVLKSCVESNNPSRSQVRFSMKSSRKMAVGIPAATTPQDIKETSYAKGGKKKTQLTSSIPISSPLRASTSTLPPRIHSVKPEEAKHPHYDPKGNQEVPEPSSDAGKAHALHTLETQRKGDEEEGLPTSQSSPGEALSPPGEHEDAEPTFFISKFKKTFTLRDAQAFQQHMTFDEFEAFTELQDSYLNVF